MNWKIGVTAGTGLRIVTALGVLLLGLTVWIGWPMLSKCMDRILESKKISAQDASARTSNAHTHVDSKFAGHASPTFVNLTTQAMKNLGLTAETLKPIELSSYKRTISVPAIVAARPGRTQIRVSSPLSGVVTHVHAVTGESVTVGHMLFEIRLAYEDLVDSQTQFLKSLSELEVEKREIARLEEVTQSGAISGKLLIERRYAKEKLEAFLSSMREALKLHGLSAAQITKIENQRELLRDLMIEAPDIDSHGKHEDLRFSRVPIKSVSHRDAEPADLATNPRPLIVEELKVQKGQGVTPGEMLCALSDFSQLYIEGQAFEQDAPAVALAAQRGWAIDAAVPTATGRELIGGLKLAFVNNSINADSRTLSFFVQLPNQILRDETNNDGQRFVTWKYRVGQRLQLLVPVELWEEQIVLPVDAVVKEGTDYFVFQQNGSRFERVAVHVKYRDQSAIVIDNDGALFPGDVVALKSAHQLQMALKNQSGGAVDLHAGHSH